MQVTPEQLQTAVAHAVEKEKPRLLEDRYHANMNILLGHVRSAVPACRLSRAISPSVGDPLGLLLVATHCRSQFIA